MQCLSENHENNMTQNIINGIVSKINVPNLIELLVDRLSFGELQSLLLKTYELKTKKKQYIELLREYKSNRFTKPSDIDPIIQRNLELDIFSLLPEHFELLELSPLTPIGTSSVLTGINQNNVVSTIRNTDVAADTTNILALECASRRKILLKKDKKCTTNVKLCSSQRLTRGQPFQNKNYSAHFNVVALCTAGRDAGNDHFEIVNLLEHITFYVNILEQLIDKNEVKKINIKFFEYGRYDNSELIEHIKSNLSHKGHMFIKSEKDSEFGKNYYSRLRFMISVVSHNDLEYDYIDGGFSDWTAKLLSNRKERLLTSGIGTDFLLRTVKYEKKSGQS